MSIFDKDMNKNLILMSALFAGSMIVSSGFGANLDVDITSINEFITHDKLSNIDNSNLLNTTYNIEENRDFKFESYDMLEYFISVYHDNTTAMDLIIPARLRNISTYDLIKTTRYIKERYDRLRH